MLNPAEWFRRNPHKDAARQLYLAVVGQARQADFYTRCGVPDTVTGRFDLIALHGFLVMNRLKDSQDRDSLSQAFVEMVVDDLDRNLREMGTGDLSVGKKVKRLMEGFYGRLEGYQEALQADDALLVAALLRNLYAGATPAEAQLQAVAHYVRREADQLANQSINELGAGEIRFGSPPAGELRETGNGC